ncbi:pyridoxal phosphate-dependent transferase [Cladochytrium replicatum]|nr:pyridoxal phosphate-dependent transferase [Cladochytrium replicatum]
MCFKGTPIHTKKILNEELEVWAETYVDFVSGVHGHFDHKYGRNWRDMDELTLVKESARIVAFISGAEEDEIAIMNSLTSNFHFMLVSFYRPTKDRYKILMERPTTYGMMEYGLESQVKFHRYDPKDAIVEVLPREGELTLRPNHILEIIEREGYKGCVVGWDLAHAVGNLPTYLHDWNVDFACWRTYKYLNSGPGYIVLRFHGWFGSEVSTRFRMENIFRPDPTAAVYPLQPISSKFSIEHMRAKSLLLTGYLEALLEGLRCLEMTDSWCDHFQGPLDSALVCDLREPDVIRVAPARLYNTFSDVVTSSEFSESRL